MNILPFVIGMLLLFVMLSSSFIHEQKNLSTIESAYSAFGKTNRLLLSKIEQDRFRSLPEKKTPNEDPKESSEEQEEKDVSKDFVSFRSKTLCDVEASKVNLNGIHKDNTPIAYETAANLLVTLYGHTKFFPKDDDRLPYKILDSLLAQCQKTKGQKIEDLYSKDDIDTVWYKIFRGTKNYNLQKKIGYPPLHHFFTVQPQQNRAICFLKASSIILEAHFGEKIVYRLLEKEKQKWEESKHKKQALTKKELQHFLQESFPQEFGENDFSQDLGFTHWKSEKKRYYVQDEKTGISLEETGIEDTHTKSQI